jgi:hypothetical protein
VRVAHAGVCSGDQEWVGVELGYGGAVVQLHRKLVKDIREDGWSQDADETTKRLFPWKSIMFEDLVKHDFDLSRMGQVLLELRAVDTVPVMRAVFSALFPNADDQHSATNFCGY